MSYGFQHKVAELNRLVGLMAEDPDAKSAIKRNERIDELTMEIYERVRYRCRILHVLQARAMSHLAGSGSMRTGKQLQGGRDRKGLYPEEIRESTGLDAELMFEEMAEMRACGLIYFEPEPEGYSLEDLSGVMAVITSSGSFRALGDCSVIVVPKTLRETVSQQGQRQSEPQNEPGGD